MFLVDLFKYIHIKFAQWAIIYLFFTKIINYSTWPLLLAAFTIDKILKILIIILDYKYEKWTYFLQRVILFILQIDELPNFAKRDQYISRITPWFIIINSLFTLQVVYIIFWCLCSRDETSFYISMPIILVIAYYQNFEIHRFYKDINFFLKFSAYFSLIYLGIGIKYFLVFFFTQYFVVLMVLSKKIKFLLDSYQNYYSKVFTTLSIAIEMILVTEMRKSMKKYSVKLFNYVLVSKFIIFISLSTIVFLSLAGYIELDKNGISDDLILFIMTVSLLSLFKYIYEIYYYIFYKNALILEIEGLQDLKKYNIQHRNGHLNLDKIKSIKIISYYRQLSFQQRKSKEFMYALLFNFPGFTISIDQIGNRKYNFDGNMVVAFDSEFDVNDLEDYLEDSTILENITKIYLPRSFYISQDIIKLFKLTFRPLNPIMIQPLFDQQNLQNIMAEHLKIFQEKNNLEIYFLHIISFQNNIQNFMNNGTSLILYDLYEL